MASKLVLAVAFAASSLANLSAAQSAPPASKVKAAIQSLYDRQNVAADKKDTRGMLAFISPSFVGVDTGGHRISYQDMVDSVEQIVGMATDLEAGTVVRECKVTGNKAVVRVDDEVRMLMISAGDQQKAQVDDISSSTDTWTRTRAGWHMVASRVIAHKVTVNGQPAPDVPGM